MKRTSFLILSASVLLVPEVIAQCNQQSNPDKWLYGNAAMKKEIPGPEHFEYATKMKFLFEQTHSYTSQYSFTKSGSERLFNFTFTINHVPPFKMTPANYVTIHVGSGEPVKLYAMNEYKSFGGKAWRFSTCFFRLTKEDVERLASAPMDSLEINYTVLPNPKKGLNEETSKSLVIDDMGKGKREDFMEMAKCYLTDY